jgi:hypothetical protein
MQSREEVSEVRAKVIPEVEQYQEENHGDLKNNLEENIEVTLQSSKNIEVGCMADRIAICELGGISTNWNVQFAPKRGAERPMCIISENLKQKSVR